MVACLVSAKGSPFLGWSTNLIGHDRKLSDSFGASAPPVKK
jgi:hypothetical protein